VTASLVRLNSNDGASSAGSLASPIRVASPSGLVQPTLELLNTTAPTHVALVGGPTLGRLQLQGTVAGLGGSTITGAANLNTLTLSDGGGVLNLSADASGGLANGFVVQATNGSLNVGSLSLPGVAVDLSSSAAVSVGTLTGGSLSVSSPGALTIGSATTTAGFGIVASTGACNTSIVGACATSAPIAAATLSAGGTGQIRLTNRDNGDISVTSLTAGGIVNISAGNIFRTSFSSFNPTTQRTANNVVLGTVVAGQSVTVANQGEGNTSVASLDASGSVSVQAGGTFLPTLSTPSRTTGSVSIGNTEPLGASGNFSINQQGTGSLTLTGAVDRSNSGQINLTAANGSITALDALTARFGIAVSAPAGTLSLGQLSTGGGSSNGNITLQSSGDLTFASLLASAPSANSGNITISSGSGSVQTTADTIGNDVVGSGNVGISAGQAIGNGNFTNPLDIQSGVNNASRRCCSRTSAPPGCASRSPSSA